MPFLKFIKKQVTNLRRFFRGFCTVDKCLLLFMGILLLQAAYSLFAHQQPGNNQGVDVVVRTSAASIFGYFVSRNFCHTPEQTKAKPTAPKQENSLLSKEEPPAQEPVLPENTQKPENKNCVRIQAQVATAIGLFSLLVLLCYRNFCVPTQEAAGTLSQLRDFVSGCIGFLIGSKKGVS